MNLVILQGNISNKGDVTFSVGREEEAVANLHFGIAINGKAKTTFLNCTAFGKTAEFIDKYFAKGAKILVRGHLSVSDYTDKNNVKRRDTSIIVDTAEFCEKRKGDEQTDEK